jgi:hypothetical protein
MTSTWDPEQKGLTASTWRPSPTYTTWLDNYPPDFSWGDQPNGRYDWRVTRSNLVDANWDVLDKSIVAWAYIHSELTGQPTVIGSGAYSANPGEGHSGCHQTPSSGRISRQWSVGQPDVAVKLPSTYFSHFHPFNNASDALETEIRANPCAGVELQGKYVWLSGMNRTSDDRTAIYNDWNNGAGKTEYNNYINSGSPGAVPSPFNLPYRLICGKTGSPTGYGELVVVSESDLVLQGMTSEINSWTDCYYVSPTGGSVVTTISDPPEVAGNYSFPLDNTWRGLTCRWTVSPENYSHPAGDHLTQGTATAVFPPASGLVHQMGTVTNPISFRLLYYPAPVWPPTVTLPPTVGGGVVRKSVSGVDKGRLVTFQP